MDMFTIIEVLKGYYGDSFTEAQVRKHLKHIDLGTFTVEDVLDEAKKQGLLAEGK